METKENKGVTLIALEVTIIVMLILEGETMTKHSYVAKFKRKDGFVFTKRFLASDLFEAVEHALEYATKRDILYLDLGHAG